MRRCVRRHSSRERRAQPSRLRLRAAPSSPHPSHRTVGSVRSSGSCLRLATFARRWKAVTRLMFPRTGGPPGAHAVPLTRRRSSSAETAEASAPEVGAGAQGGRGVSGERESGYTCARGEGNARTVQLALLLVGGWFPRAMFILERRLCGLRALLASRGSIRPLSPAAFSGEGDRAGARSPNSGEIRWKDQQPAAGPFHGSGAPR